MRASQRFYAKVAVPPEGDGCWLWVGAMQRNGYGKMRYEGKIEPAHRVSWRLHSNEPIPEGYEIDHLCSVRRCVRFSHLRLATHRDNVLRGNAPTAINARRETCAKGHPFDVVYSGHRGCRRCNNARALARYYAKKVAV